MSWLFLSVQYFDVFIDVHIFRCLVYIMQNVIFKMISVQSCVFEYFMIGFQCKLCIIWPFGHKAFCNKINLKLETVYLVALTVPFEHIKSSQK